MELRLAEFSTDEAKRKLARQNPGSRWNSCCTPTRATRAGCLPTPSYGKPVLLYDLKCVGSQA
jgi:hypothetical protein